MTKTEIWEKIKTSNVKTFRAFDPLDKLTYRCAIEENGSIFVYAKKKKRYGWRYSEEVFLRNFEPILPTDENLKWKRRLKRAVKLCKASGLWEEIAVIWDNLYKYVTLEEKNKIYDMSWDNRDAAIGLSCNVWFNQPRKFAYPMALQCLCFRPTISLHKFLLSCIC